MALRRFVAVGDNHGNLVDKTAANVAFDFTDEFKPDYRIHLGDLRDNACLRMGASIDEQQQPLDEDWEMGEWFASRFFGARCTNVFLQGNHDAPRIEAQLLNAKGEAITARAKRELGHTLLDEHKALMKRLNVTHDLPYDARNGVFEIGRLRFIHGYHHCQNAAKKHAEIYGNAIFGHIHRPQHFSPPHIDGSFGQSGGCLCDLDPPYMMKNTSKLSWAHEFLYGFVDESGDDFQVFRARKIGNIWIFPTEMREVAV